MVSLTQTAPGAAASAVGTRAGGPDRPGAGIAVHQRAGRRRRPPDPGGREPVPGHQVYVCNLRPQDPETAGFDVARHVEALVAHGVDVDVRL